MKLLCITSSCLTGLCVFFSTFNALALQPPRPGEIEQLRVSGKLDKRLERAAAYGNHITRPDLVRRSQETIARLAGSPLPSAEEVSGVQLLNGMPSFGTNKVLIMLLEFPDYPHTVSYETMSNMVLGTGNPSHYPRESLKNYYLRSSYSNLVIEGSVLGWYQMAHNRNWYTNTYGDGNYANYQIIQEAVDHYDATIDYSQFDNNNDGRIDYFVVFWTGPTGPWASFWWGYQWALYSGNLTRDGVRFYTFSWQWQSDRPTVVIHETGHALGLPDYYDYDGNVGPDGGVGGLDMMHANKGDHCAFSKFMLGWIEPTFVVTNLNDYPLRASAQYLDAAIIMPNIEDESKAFSEYFMVQNRHRILNDGNGYMPSDGMLIWHVDATPTTPGGSNFKYNNSYSSHKLLRLMEADGLEEIEMNRSGDAGDYYNNGDTFSPLTSPNSDAYDGSTTWVTVDDLSANGVTMTADLLIVPEPGSILFLLGLGILLRRCVYALRAV